MNGEINVRLADRSDAEVLVEFNRAMAKETENLDLSIPVLTAGVESLLNDTRYGFYVVAEETAPGGQREIIASLMVTYEWSDWRNGLFWWIQSVYVKPGFRRRGVYRKLYEFVKGRAAADETNGKVCGFRLYVERDNSVAQETYARLGMTETHYKMFQELCEG